MRVVEIVPSLEEKQGGPSKSVLGLSGALARLGEEVTVLATEPGVGSTQAAEGIRTEVFHRDWPQRLCPSRGLRTRLRQLQPEIVHHHTLWLRTLHYAHRRARSAGVPLVISPRGMMAPWTWAHRKWRKRLGRQLIHPGALAAASGWHATSEAEATDIRRCGFHQPICIAPNGVELPAPEQMAAAAASWHQRCPSTAQRPVALFYSRFHRKKRVLELIDAWLAHGPRDWLLLVAGIPQEYSAERLSDYVLRASGGGRVEVVDAVGLPPPYAVASLFLLPSHDENFGLVIAEALAAGVPAVVTDTTPWLGLNDHGGWCGPWSDFVKNLRQATSEGPGQLRARGARARAWVDQEYSWDRPARLLSDFYQSLRASGVSS
jgi:glycosyltransferase involved in cell wall biosynthesis